MDPLFPNRTLFRSALGALRQPLETGRVSVARANAHVTYPARVQLVAAMNPCRCGYLDDPGRACARAPRCAADYQAKISGPLFDRIDLHVDEIGRASCRERVCQYVSISVVAVTLKKTQNTTDRYNY